MEARSQFTFYRSYFEALSELPDKDRLKVYDSICDYALNGVEHELKSVPKTVFTLVRPTIDAGRKKAKGGKSGKPNSKDNGKMDERPSKDTAKEKEKEIEKERENEIENECYRAGEKTEQAPGSMFTSFWDKYPTNRGGREPAYQAWKALNPDICVARLILSSLDTFCKCKQWTEADGKYIPSAARFLSDRLFEKPPVLSVPDCPKGASGRLGQAELEAIQQALRQPDFEEGGCNHE